jgi:hypothetical protein
MRPLLAPLLLTKFLDAWDPGSKNSLRTIKDYSLITDYTLRFLFLTTACESNASITSNFFFFLLTILLGKYYK